MKFSLKEISFAELLGKKPIRNRGVLASQGLIDAIVDAIKGKKNCYIEKTPANDFEQSFNYQVSYYKGKNQYEAFISEHGSGFYLTIIKEANMDSCRKVSYYDVVVKK